MTEGGGPKAGAWMGALDLGRKRKPPEGWGPGAQESGQEEAWKEWGTRLLQARWPGTQQGAGVRSVGL